MVTLKLDIDDFVEMLSDRALWWDHQIGNNEAEVYSDYFLEVGPDVYDGGTVTQTIPEIVDNFIINDTSVMTEEAFLNEYDDYDTIEDAIDDGKIIYQTNDGYYIVDNRY